MATDRFTPDNLTELGENEIHVFGRYRDEYNAHMFEVKKAWQAIPIKGIGLQGNNYILPIITWSGCYTQPYVNEFIEFAKQHPELTFFVTHEELMEHLKKVDAASLFQEALEVENIILPQAFAEYLIIRSKQKALMNDPLVAEYIKAAEREAEKEVEKDWGTDLKGKLGYCHFVWRYKKRILKEKYGIDWLTPAERNPNIRFD